MLAVLLILALLCGCTPLPANQTPVVQQPAAEMTAAPRSDSRELVFVIAQDASDLLRAAATYFCTEMGEITQGAVTMTVMESDYPQNELLSGRAQAGFLDQKRHMAFSQPLSATAHPFLYSGYRNFTMRANASSTLELLESALRRDDGLLPLAAYYQGTQHLLASFSITNYMGFEGAIVAIGEDAAMEAVIGRLGGEHMTGATATERYELYWNGEVTVLEMPLEELARQAELPTSSYLILSAHNTVPVWLLTNAGFYDGLTPAQQAGIVELCAYMTNLIDDQAVKREERLLDAINLPGLTYLTEFSNVRNRVFNTMEPLDEQATVEQVVTRDLITLIRRIS